eukprot:gene3493-4387_t
MSAASIGDRSQSNVEVITGDYGITDHFNLKEVPASISNAIFLQHNGNIQTGNFRLGHDVNVPPLQHLDDKTSPLFAVFLAHNATAGFDIINGRVKDYNARMASSVFCLAPPGTDGRGQGDTAVAGVVGLSVVAGCIPVIIQDNVRQPLEELLPYDAFSIAEMQRHLACAAPRWLFSTVYGAYGNEDGSQDAVESVLQVALPDPKPV